MLDVARWLAEQGLGHHAEAFAENGIAGDVLRDLTDADLKELGLNLGDRKRLLKAIAALAAGPADVRTDVAEPDATPPVPREAERRQLTVLFCDLVGSTELAARLDPEDMSALIRAYQNAVAGEITRFEGHIAKYMGDGVLAYFGWPRAHEDAAERAVRAGLAIGDALAALETPAAEGIAARIGIATGAVVVGELIGEGMAQERAVIGETPNLAARLQALAEPGGIVISARTRQLVGGLFELADLGPQHLKGFAGAVPAWRVVGIGAAESRFEALHAAGLTPLIGRAHELGLLLDRWELARRGEGQVVLLSGEPGIGKSRLIWELRARLAGERYTWLGHYCSPYHVNSALHPVIDLLHRAAGFERDEAIENRLRKLEGMLARGTFGLDEAVPLVAALLGIETGRRYPRLELTPERQKQRTFEALLGQLKGLCVETPVLALYEDLHWADPSTLELLGIMVDRAKHLPVLAVMTFRPEFTAPWTGHVHVTTLTLSRLGQRQGARMVERLTGSKPLPAEVLEQILAKTDGVPLFVEELTRTVLESGLLADAGDRFELAAPLPPLAIPATLHDSLIARLDRLAPVKEVAQIGAAIGREFSFELLAAVAPVQDAELQDALDQLCASELVFCRGTPPDATYSFKHALVQEAAYQSLLKSKRREIHARVVAALEEQFSKLCSVEPELLAHHCFQAGLLEKAAGYSYRAGQRAIARAAAAEAVAQLKQGLNALAALGEDPERRRKELHLQIALGGALIAARGYSADETGQAFARARELGEEIRDVHQLMPVLNGQVLFHIERQQYQLAFRIAENMRELAQQDGRARPEFLIPAHRALSLTSYELRRFAAAREHAEQVLALYEPDRHRMLRSLYAFDQRAVALGYLAASLFVLGYPDQAQQRSEQQLVEARSLAHPNTLAQALSRACVFCRMTRDERRLGEAAEALVAVSAEHGLPYFRAIGMLHRGRVLIACGRLEDGVADIDGAAAAAEDARAPWSRAYVSAVAAEACALAGCYPEAANWAAAALATWDEVGSPWFQGDRHWHKGRLLLWLDDPNWGEAERCFRRGMEEAGLQGAKMWELRAATSLAQLWAQQGRRSEAYDLLAPVYGWFTEGFCTADLKDAKALLDEVG